MGRRGPRAKPTAIKLLEGCRADRINDAEPSFPADGDLAAPAWLDAIGREHWQELAPLLHRAGVLTAGDRAALAQLCDDYSTIRHAVAIGWDELQDDFERVRSAMANADRARERYRRMLIEFGLTPSSRSRLKVSPEKPQDDLGEFLGEKTG